MTDEQPLVRTLRTLERLRVEYMLTGSYASNVYGRVRSTFDADIVAALGASAMGPLAQALEDEGFYCDAKTLAEVESAGAQFNAVHRPSGLKIDFYLPKTPHDRIALRRRRAYDLWGLTVWIVSPEDLILAKLLWAERGGSGRQIEDAEGVCRVQAGNLDEGYLRERAAELSLTASVDRILAR